MSFSCPFDDANAPPTIPCEDDTVVSILRDLLGADYVNAFLKDGVSPALVQATDTTLSMTLSMLASVAMTAAILISVISIYKWVTESANDGEAVGLSERGGILGMFGRPFFSIALLVPTASGYPTINLVIMTVVLWANGATNQLYDTIAQRAINLPSIDESYLDSELFLKASDVTDSYIIGATSGYCLSLMINEQAQMQVYKKIDGVTATNSTADAKISFRDTNSQLGSKNEERCGSFSIERFFPASLAQLPDSNQASRDPVFNEILKIQQVQARPLVGLMNLRGGYAALAYTSGMLTALGKENFDKVWYFPLGTSNGMGGTNSTMISNASSNRSALSKYFHNDNSSTPLTRNAFVTSGGMQGWDVDMTAESIQNPIIVDKLLSDAATINAKLLEESRAEIRAAVARVKNQGSSDAQIIEAAANNIKRMIFSQGWMNAGNAQAKLRQLGSGATSKVGYKPYTVNFSLGLDTQSLTEDGAHLNVATRHHDVVSGMANQIGQQLPKDHPAQLSLGAYVMQANLSAGGDNAQAIDALAGSTTNFFHGMNEKAISLIVNTEGSEEDTLTRIQNFGEWMLIAIASALGVMVSIRIMLAFMSTAAETTSGLTLGTASGLAAAANNFKDLVDSLLLAPLKELMDSFFLISRIFGVVIPSMPYIFLILAGIGWFVQIIQTMFGMPLWLIMHSIPEKSFIGSQQQGYVTLLSMLFRPLLIISGFFVAFDLYDPLVVYATKAFFDSYGAISGATAGNSVSESLIYLASLKYWYYLYAGVLMAITYLIFGLVQELSDSVLDWLGTNLLRGFGNMDSKSTVQGISSSMSNSAAKGSAAIAGGRANKRQARAAQSVGNKKPNPDDGDGDGNGNGGGGGNGGGNGGNPISSAAVVDRTGFSDGNRDVTDTHSTTPQSVNNDPNNTTQSNEGSSKKDSSDENGLPANKEVVSSGTQSEVTSQNIGDDIYSGQDNFDSTRNAVGDEAGATQLSNDNDIDAASTAANKAAADLAATQDTEASAVNLRDSDSDSSVSTPTESLNAAAVTSSDNKVSSAPLNRPASTVANIAAASGLIVAGGVLANKANGAPAMKAGESVVLTDVGVDKDMMARVSKTEDGYSAALYKTNDGVESLVGTESVSTASNGDITMTTTSTGDAGEQYHDTSIASSNGDLLNRTRVDTTPDGSSTTSIDDYSNGTYTNSNTVGSVTHTEVADSNTGMPIQISTSDTSADTESSVSFANDGANWTAMGAVSRNGDNVVASTYNPDNASVTTMTGTIDPAGNVIPQAAVVTENASLGDNGRIVLDTPPDGDGTKSTTNNTSLNSDSSVTSNTSAPDLSAQRNQAANIAAVLAVGTASAIGADATNSDSANKKSKAIGGRRNTESVVSGVTPLAEGDLPAAGKRTTGSMANSVNSNNPLLNNPSIGGAPYIPQQQQNADTGAQSSVTNTKVGGVASPKPSVRVGSETPSLKRQGADSTFDSSLRSTMQNPALDQGFADSASSNAPAAQQQNQQRQTVPTSVTNTTANSTPTTQRPNVDTSYNAQVQPSTKNPSAEISATRDSVSTTNTTTSQPTPPIKMADMSFSAIQKSGLGSQPAPSRSLSTKTPEQIKKLRANSAQNQNKLKANPIASQLHNSIQATSARNSDVGVGSNDTSGVSQAQNPKPNVLSNFKGLGDSNGGDSSIIPNSSTPSPIEPPSPSS